MNQSLCWAQRAKMNESDAPALKGPATNYKTYYPRFVLGHVKYKDVNHYIYLPVRQGPFP